LLLLVMAGFIISQAIGRIEDPVEVPSIPMFVMAIGGIGLEIAALAIMYRGQKGDLNIRGSFWHVVNAFLGSLAVIIAALFIQFGDIYVADAWAGLLFSLILIWAAYGILRDVFRILIDATPPDVDLSVVAAELKKIRGVIGAHHFHARTITSQVKVFSGHLVVGDVSSANRVLGEAKDTVDRKFGFNLSTIQVEDGRLEETDEESLEANL
jgi:cobalt-zinc-cadmium efflux system protein